MAEQMFMTSKEVSELTKQSVWTIQKWTREKKLPAYTLNGKTYLYKRKEVLDAIENGRTM